MKLFFKINGLRTIFCSKIVPSVRTFSKYPINTTFFKKIKKCKYIKKVPYEGKNNNKINIYLMFYNVPERCVI